MENTALADSLRNSPVAMVLSDPALPDNPLVYVNAAFEKVTLYAQEAAIGRNCRFLQCDETDPAALEKLRSAFEAERAVTVDLVNERADGTRFLNRVVISPLRDQEGKLSAYLGIQSEVDPDMAPVRGGAAGRDTETMLTELQHRVKNHLSMVVGLIRLQSRQDVTRDSFEALSHRVGSLALLYEELSAAGVVSRTAETLPTGAYLSRVANTIGGLDGRSAVRLNVACDDIALPVETGARLGLLLTELVTNALEHAFVGRDQGVISVRFSRQTRGKLRLMVEDDGVGLPEGSTWPDNAPSVEHRTIAAERDPGDALDPAGGKRKSGLGGSIVTAMIDNLDGDLTVTSSRHGTIVTIDIAEDTVPPA